jgi:hypothetical protein
MWIDLQLIGKAFVLGIAVGLVLTLAAAALPAPLSEEQPAESPRLATSGRFLMRRASGEAWAMAPNLATEASFRVAGVVARATVRQRFQYATDGWVEGVYVFPLPENAAVDHLLMKVGEREIEGQIREREQAKAEYQQAKSEVKKASLVEQERPNLFTTSVANLGPGETLVVEIEFQQTLSFDEGEVRLRFPLVVGPRYIPGQGTDEKPFGLGWALDTDLVPDASRITPPLVRAGEPLRNPVAIEVELDPGFPLQSLVSRYHAIVSQPMVDGRYHVKLRDELVPADRDFELAWTPKRSDARGASSAKARRRLRAPRCFLPSARGRGHAAAARDHVRDRHLGIDGLSVSRRAGAGTRRQRLGRGSLQRGQFNSSRRRSGTTPARPRPRTAARRAAGSNGSRRKAGPRWRARSRRRSWAATTRGSCARSCS